MNRLDTKTFCWRLERRDGAGLALTSHDAGLVLEGVRYGASPGLLPAAIHRRGGLSPGSAEIDGAVSAAALTEEDLEAGRWNGAHFRLRMVDWQSPDAGGVTLMAGELGEVAMTDAGFTAELSGPSAILDEPVCPSTSSECRATLGDRQCRIDLSGRRITAQVVEAEGNRVRTSPAMTDTHAGGQIIVMEGDATGWQSPILGVEEGWGVMRDAPWRALSAGCRVWLFEGCDKRFATCRDRFANAQNFRGEPHLPGNDLLTRYPGG